MKTQEEGTVEMELVVRLARWFRTNQRKWKRWGGKRVRVTMQNTAGEIGVAYSTFNFWLRTAEGKQEEGTLPKGLSLDAIRKFLANN